MGREANKYLAYARECARQADEAASAERRDKLMELARVWITAALSEEAAHRDADAVPRPSDARGLA
jgi:hypothetical protein